jgi:hypothetical protein
VWTLESVQKQVAKAIDRGAELYRDSIDGWVGSAAMASEVESPIEAVLLVWFYALQRVNHWDDYELDTQREVNLSGVVRRLDFSLRWMPAGEDILPRASAAKVNSDLNIAIEVDGHDFHERTREQVINRNNRDLQLQAAGWQVFHFSGSQVHNDPEGCLDAVMGVAVKKVRNIYLAIYRAEGLIKD